MKDILEELHSIPADSKEATIQGVRMELITAAHRKRLLDQDPDGIIYQDCELKNGTFVFTTDGQQNLLTLYKVIDR